MITRRHESCKRLSEILTAYHLVSNVDDNRLPRSKPKDLSNLEIKRRVLIPLSILSISLRSPMTLDKRMTRNNERCLSFDQDNIVLSYISRTR